MDWDIRKLANKPFADATPQNYVAKAAITLGGGGNGSIVVTHDDMETDDEIEIVLAAEAATALSAAYATGTITVTLGTDALGDADGAKNTAKLIAAAINGITGKTWLAAETGTGATAIASAMGATAFTNGHWGTHCPVAYTGYENGGTYYLCTVADNTAYNTGWKTFTLSNM